jgi:hypothetical protein
MVRRHKRPLWTEKAERLIRLATNLAALIELIRRSL